MSTNEQATTFWQFLNQYKIEIPIIQRDYAQGRKGKETLRKNFLSDLRTALDNGQKMKLDFVYGSRENGRLYPLDGQQRLTTLWLLHWYIALRSHNLEEASETLKNFSYETRTSSREFCESLCAAENFENYKGQDIAVFITNQTWFYSVWKQDPTVQSMLRMLGGSKDSNIADGIQKIFKCQNCFPPTHNIGYVFNESYCTFKEYYNKLTDNNCPIVFYYLEKDFGNSDDLYIKMNARGEQLTSFENFKADLIGYISHQVEKENPSSQKKWELLMDKETGIPIKLDTDWTNLFWEHKSKDYKIDDIYFAFLNRFFLNELVCLKDETKKGGNKTEPKYKFTADYLEKENKTFEYLYGDKGNDSKLNYNDLSIYRYSSDEIPFQLFDSLQKTLNNYNKEQVNEYFPDWVDSKPDRVESKFEFIPKYTKGITILGQKERVVFYAVCRYFEKDTLEESSFKRWMRVVWNIVENSGIDTISAMIGAMRLIDELAEKSHIIYEFLSGSNTEIESDFAKEQVAEEIAKAKQILDHNGKLREYHGSFKYNNWEDIIINAEKTAFFKGSIRFLFQGSDGSIIYKDNAWDTGMFDRKFANAKLFFGKDKKDKENNKEQYKLLKFFICKCSEDDKLKLIKYDILSASWKNSLLNKDLAATTHLFLIGNIGDLNNDISFLKKIIDINKPWDRAKLDLVSTGLLENITYYGEHVDGCRLREYNSQLALFPDNAKSDMKKYVLANIRNAILSELLILKKEQFHCDQKIKNCDFFWGWDINFKYKDNYFTCFTNDTVCLMNENWVGKKLRDTNKDNTIQNNYFFSVGKSEKADSFIEKLDCLIQQSAAVDANKNCFNECPNKEENNLQS